MWKIVKMPIAYWLPYSPPVCINIEFGLRLKLFYFIGETHDFTLFHNREHTKYDSYWAFVKKVTAKSFQHCNLVLAARWWCWWWCSILGVFGGAVGFNVIITGACRMRFPHGSNWTNKYALWWSFYCHDIFTLPATFIISRSGSFSDFMSLCR